MPWSKSARAWWKSFWRRLARPRVKYAQGVLGAAQVGVAHLARLTAGHDGPGARPRQQQQQFADVLPQPFALRRRQRGEGRFLLPIGILEDVVTLQRPQAEPFRLAALAVVV